MTGGTGSRSYPINSRFEDNVFILFFSEKIFTENFFRKGLNFLINFNKGENIKVLRIQRIFKTAGVTLPGFFNMTSEDAANYDDFQSWCCGHEAVLTEAGVAVRRYCLKGRGPDAWCAEYRRTGEVVSIYDDMPINFDWYVPEWNPWQKPTSADMCSYFAAILQPKEEWRVKRLKIAA